MADHEFPHNPDNGFNGVREGFEVCALADLIKEDVGLEVTLRRDEGATPGYEGGVGDPFLEPVLDTLRPRPPSLPSVA